MKVYIVGGNGQIASMFEKEGWTQVSRIEEADVVQFTGGADVSPALYNEDIHPTVFPNSGRDEKEMGFYVTAQHLGLPCVGICRGGQFLNVMNGGKLYQHVDNHGLGGTHEMYDIDSGDTIDTTSTHHQMMRPAEGATLVATAGHLTTFREHMSGESRVEGEMVEEDVEVLFYPDTQTLCHQGHPEFMDSEHESVTYYFNLIRKFLGKGVG